MSDSSPSFWKPIALFLLLVLFGVYLLYTWYDSTLYDRLAEKDARIALSTEQIKDAEARQAESEQLQADLRAEIADLKTLNAGIAQSKADLERDMDALKAAHVIALAAERETTGQVTSEKNKFAKAYNDLETLHDTAKARIMALESDLAQVQKAIVDSTAEHRAKVEALEKHLNERVSLAKLTPMDADLVRTAQAVGLLPSDDAGDDKEKVLQVCAEARSRLEALQGEHGAAREELARSKEQFAQAQDALQQTQAQLDGGKADAAAALKEAKAAHAKVLAETENRLAKLSQQVDSGNQDEEIAALRAKIQGDEALIAELKAKAAAVDEASAAQADQMSEAEAEAKIATLNERLATEGTIREELQQQHAAAITALNETLAEAKKKLAVVKGELESAKTETGQSDQAVVQRLEEANQAAEQRVAEVKETTEQRIAEAKETSAKQIAAAREAAAREIDEAKARIASLEAGLEEARDKAAKAENAVRQEAEGEIASLRALYAGFAELGGTYTPRGLLLRLAEAELRFPAGQVALPQGDFPSLDRIAALLAQQPALTIRIEGHTDSLGGDAINLPLSQQRADAVKQALVERGVAVERITAEGIGAARPIAGNATAEGRGRNRRVEVYVLE